MSLIFVISLFHLHRGKEAMFIVLFLSDESSAIFALCVVLYVTFLLNMFSEIVNNTNSLSYVCIDI